MKLELGDEVRIIAPSKSMKVLTKDQIDNAKMKLENIMRVVRVSGWLLKVKRPLFKIF